MPFDRVVLIFNPHSTGDAPGRAEELSKALHDLDPGLRVEMQPTQYAGHARLLAAQAAEAAASADAASEDAAGAEGPAAEADSATAVGDLGSGAAHQRPLIVSVSGDGGYNEVVNGIMDAGNPHVVAAVVAAGNANDHHRVTDPRPLPEAVAAEEVRPMDLLRMTIQSRNKQLVRYAHSYIGVGLTPVVAVELEKGSKGSMRELVTVVRSFGAFRPLRIELSDGRRMAIDSLVFSNIPEMAKVLKLSDNGDPEDGEFEVTLTQHEPRWRALTKAAKAATTGLGEQPAVTEFRFRVLKAAPLQIDGELMDVESGDEILVEIAAGALATLR